MNLLKTYLESNKKSLLIYIGVCLLFYILNFIFYRNNIDAPVDLIFAILFSAIAPGILVFYTLFKNDYLVKNNRNTLLLINILIPFLILFVFNMIYWAIEMQDLLPLGGMLLLNVISFPLMIFAVIIMLLFRYYRLTFNKLLLRAVVIYAIYYVSLFGLGIIEKQIENSIYTNIGYFILFIIIPLVYMMYLVKRLDTKFMQ